MSEQNSLGCLTKHPDPAIFSESLSLIFSEKVKSETIQQSLTRWVEEIRDWAKDNAYFVGHIKVFLEGRENLWLSSTGRSINIKRSEGWSEWSADKAVLSVTAIIFGSSKAALREAAQERLRACLNCLNLIP
ncbi:hypothetical protein [Desulfosporosinus youngiae]|uniref:Uncharacterized protein n=1 Tax=Desulfosporosinus youngiae DSM 17734 TaxID=768710 RepID=H5Y2V2_9FIRM|nr:hypothetical protein [Desulfosporosinus youngiae]EHQ88509.1 hypothetical protein DesyoDRAFT_1351 [Desulfosporosinus youngiae DSM 17734]